METEQKPKNEARRAFTIGGSCIFIYLVSYYLRNLLSYFQTDMTANGGFTVERVAILSSAYMLAYAAGQLVNGALGDHVHPRFMVLLGLSLSGTSLLVFPFVSAYVPEVFCFIGLGVGLSCLRGPIVRVISENTSTKAARVSCMFLSFASVAGPFLTALMAIFFSWRNAFFVSAGVAYFLGVLGFVLLTLFEKKGIIRVTKKAPGEKTKIDLFGAFRLRGFFSYFLMAMIGEIATTTIVYWIPAYIEDGLSFPGDQASILSAVISLLRAAGPFAALAFYRLLGRNIKRCYIVTFGASAIFLFALLLPTPPVVRILFFLLALFITTIGQAEVWNVYLPSLGKTGKVSSANGLLDCAGYFAASLANVVFAELFSAFSWNGMIVGWGVAMALGLVLTLFLKYEAMDED